MSFLSRSFPRSNTKAKYLLSVCQIALVAYAHSKILFVFFLEDNKYQRFIVFSSSYTSHSISARHEAKLFGYKSNVVLFFSRANITFYYCINKNTDKKWTRNRARLFALRGNFCVNHKDLWPNIDSKSMMIRKKKISQRLIAETDPKTHFMHSTGCDRPKWFVLIWTWYLFLYFFFLHLVANCTILWCA